jgi:cell division protein FtsN
VAGAGPVEEPPSASPAIIPDVSGRNDASPAPAAPRPRAGAEARAGAAGPTARFTVQVGAFNARGPAEALRARLGGAGHDAYVAETGGPGPRYRVRVGSYVSRDTARQVARRLAAERHLATYVTAR